MHNRYRDFGLVLMVTRNCNLRCSYCYAGAKTGENMPVAVGEAAIRRASHSLLPGGGLELGFFGGEPLLASETVSHLLDYARSYAHSAGHKLSAYLSTNGTVTDEPARRQRQSRDGQGFGVSSGWPNTSLPPLAFLTYIADGNVANGHVVSCGAAEYFLLGDETRDSQDSRYEGAVARGRIIGRPLLRIWPLARWGWVNP